MNNRKLIFAGFLMLAISAASFFAGRMFQRPQPTNPDPLSCVRPSLVRLKIAAESGATIDEFRKLVFEFKSAAALNTNQLPSRSKSLLPVIEETADAITASWTFALTYPNSPYDTTNSFSFFILKPDERERVQAAYLKEMRDLTKNWNTPADHFDQNLATHILMRHLVDDTELLLRDLPKP